MLKIKLKSHRPKSANAPYVPVKRRLEKIQSTIATKPKENVRELTEFLSQQKFDDLGLSLDVLKAIQQGHLKHLEDPQPTEIQALSIPKLLRSNRHVLCAAETGSGKTLAYLAPTLHMLKLDEKKVRRRLDHPRAIVLVPTRELVSQVVKTAKSLGHACKHRSLGITSRTPRHQLLESLADGPVDILVTIPTALMTLIKNKTISLTDTRYLIIDEADSLFDSGWGDDCRSIIEQLKTICSQQKVTEKVIVVSATLPRSVHTALDSLFPDMLKITTPSLHRALPNLKQSFVDLARFNGNRQMALLEVLKKNIKDGKTLVFCNTKKAVELLHQWLKTKHINAMALYKDTEMSREEILRLFSTPADTVSLEPYVQGDTKELPLNPNVLLSTDIASRGIDTTFVDHVILFDFPTSVVDYLHRVGRTARAGQKGKATSLIGSKDKMMADRIRRSIREGSVMT
ncbi:P-loop containing nucleoside triphosphate hydrolase protein [Spinellus fusiger]|nr:P-loop containing nucleoside triphosphate hydrolase protein [Spinellus fusiger]